MRNLKRALSLTLASVMLLGMMVIGSSAAAGYSDVDADDNVEAIEVLQAIEVMVGDDRGFGPDRPVNRAEMAVVMGLLLNLDYNYYVSTCPFADVSGNYEWARGWVGACAANGIVSGRGEGIYDPAATVTAVEAASMMMRALGYFRYQNDYADGFVVSTVRQGTKIGLFKGVGSDGSTPMTRNQVAQMALNALKSGMVEPDGNTTTFLDPDGSIIATTGKVNYVYVTSSQSYATAVSNATATSIGSTNQGYIVELGEQLYNGDLKLYAYTDDEFMRPSRTWEYDGKEVGTYMKKENIREEYTAGVTKRDLYDRLGRTILQEYDFAYYVDGVLVEDTAANILSRQTNDYGETGNGVLTQVFVDVEAETIDITSINTYLAKAANDYSKTTESVSLNIYGSITKTNPSPVVYRTDSYTKAVSLTDVPAVENVKMDQYLLVNVSGKDYTSHTRKTLTGYDVVAISEPEILSESTLTKFSKRSSDSDTSSDSNQALFKSVVTGGTEYKNSAYAVYNDSVLDLYDDDRLVNKTYNIYLDKYGYAIGIDLFEGESNYVFITGFDPSGSNIAYGNANAAAIFADGSQAVIKVDTKATNANIDKVDGAGSYFEQWTGAMQAPKYALNRWYTYTVDSNNVYTLHPATRMITTEVTAPLTIKTNSVRIDENASNTTYGTPPANYNGTAAGNTGTRVYGNDNSTYIVVDTGDTDTVDNSVAKVITDVSGVYTGVQSVEIEVTATTDGNPITGTELCDSIYTVYDKNNYIIASVVIGEAKGGNANYAYILTAATFEERVDGNTVWGFDAIVDGKIVHLTTSSKFSSVISKLQPGHVQELRYSGDYVSGVKTPDKATQYWQYADAIDSTKYITNEEIYDVGHDYFASNRNDCAAGNSHATSDVPPVPYITDEGHLTKLQANNLKIVGNTMYFREKTETIGGVTYTKDTGLAFVAGAPAVVIQTVDSNVKKIECASVAQAIAELGDPDVNTTEKEFEGRIVAVLNSQGAAKWVVFISDTPVNTKGIAPVGGDVEITVKRVLDNGTGAKQELQPVVLTRSTSAFTASNYWTISATGTLAAPAGYTAMIPSQDVYYVRGQKTYEISFTYVKNAPVPYTVKFDGNGATAGTIADLTETAAGAGVTLPAATPLTAPTGKVFAGWALKATDSTATAGVAGAKYRPTADCTLYAVWGTVYTVTFDINGETAATGAIASPIAQATPGAAITLPAVGAIVTGKAFMEWNTKADGTGTAYDPTDSYTPATNETLYAIWASTDATLSGATVSVPTGQTGATGGTAATGGTTGAEELNITVTGTAANGDKLTVAFTKNDANATLSVASVELTFNGTDWSTGSVTVTAEDGTTQITYTVQVP